MTGKSIKIGIIDDEEKAIQYLALLVEELPDYEIAFTKTDPLEGLALVKDSACDILLLDIMMPGLKGNVLAAMIKSFNIPVIFISGHDMSAKDAFEVKAVDFLSKPVSLIQLYDALEKAKKTINMEYASLYKNTGPGETKREYLYLAIGLNSIKRILISDIIVIGGGSDYSEILVGETVHRDNRPLKELEIKLKDYGIIRVHKSYMINLHKALTFYRTNVTMLGGKEIPVGRTYRDSFLRIIREKVW